LLADMAVSDDVDETDRRTLVGQIGDAAAELGTALGELVGALRPGGATLGALARQIGERARHMFPGSTPRLELHLPGDAMQPLSLAVRHNVFLIAAEALHNAARHSGARTVRVALEPDGRRCRLTVHDDGGGFDTGTEVDTADTGDEGLGLTSMRRRAAGIGAELTIESERGGGCMITLAFDPGSYDRRVAAGRGSR
jgi:signal transduction histidine kinase